MTDLQKFNDIYLYLRNATNPWRYDSYMAANSKCCITGNLHNLEVHHLNRNFADIVRETFISADLQPSDTTDAYSIAELDRLAAHCLALHYHYGLGVVLSQRMHRMFHAEYGLITTAEDFKNFKAAQKAYRRRKAA